MCGGPLSGGMASDPSIDNNILVMGGSSVLLMEEIISSPSDMMLTMSVRTQSILLVNLSAFVHSS